MFENHKTNLLRLLKDESQETQWFEYIQKEFEAVEEGDAGVQQDLQIQIIDIVGLRIGEVETGLQKTSSGDAGADGGGAAEAATKAKLIDLVKKLFQAQILEYQNLLNNLDESLLESCGILNATHEQSHVIPGDDSGRQMRTPALEYYKQLRKRADTRQLYNLDQFNLQREENEGYSKLVVQLVQPDVDNVAEEDLSNLVLNIQQLIGYFDLNPNRVLDIVLEAFEINLVQHAVYAHNGCQIVDFQKLHSIKSKFEFILNQISIATQQEQAAKLTSLLGLKISTLLQNFKMTPEKTGADPIELVPFSLILLIALLIRDDFIKVEEIWPYFVKKVRNKEGEVVDERDEIATYHKGMERILGFKYQALGRSTLGEDKEAVKIEKEANYYRKWKNERLPYNFQLWLVACLLKVNDFEDAELIIGSMWGDEKIDLRTHKELLLTLFWYVEKIVQQMHSDIPTNQKGWGLKRAHNTKNLDTIPDNGKGVKTCRAPEDLCKAIPIILRVLGVHLGLNTAVFLRLLKVVNHYMVGNLSKAGETLVQNIAFEMTGRYFLPALTVVREHDLSLDSEIWQILRAMEVNQRFAFYHDLMTRSYLTNGLQIERIIQLQQQVAHWSKRVNSDSKRVKILRKDSQKFANSGNGLMVASQMILQCTNYENLHLPFISTMEEGSFHDLTLDMLSFGILKHLAEKQDQYRTLDDEALVCSDLKNLADFTALLCKTFPQIDKRPLLTYLLNKMKRSNSCHEMTILSKILHQMYGWKESLDDFTDIDLLAGGLQMKLEDTGGSEAYLVQNSSRKALVNLFWGSEVNSDQDSQKLTLAFRLMVHLAQQTQVIISEDETNNLVFIQNNFDKVHDFFMQLTDTLSCVAEDRQKYQKLIPNQIHTPSILSLEYKLPFRYSFHIIRKSSMPIYRMSEQQFASLVQNYCSIFEHSLQNQVSHCEANLYSDDDDYPYFDEVAYLKNKDDNIWKMFSREVFTIFWQLELQDIVDPELMYTEFITKKHGEKKLDQLKHELNHQQKPNYQSVMKFLKEKLGTFFEQMPAHQFESSIFLIQNCIYPRILMSPADALYSINFLRLLISLRVPNINVRDILTQIFQGKSFQGIIPAIHCCTEKEAENLGIFLIKFFEMINGYTNETVWNEKCAQYEGFKKKNGGMLENQTFKDWLNTDEKIDKILAGSITQCLKNPKEQFMKTRCALKILYRIRKVFPRRLENAAQIDEELAKIEEKRPDRDEIKKDVWTIARSYRKNLLELIEGMKKKEETEKQKNKQNSTNQPPAGARPNPERKGLLAKREHPESASRKEEEGGNQQPTQKRQEKTARKEEDKRAQVPAKRDFKGEINKISAQNNTKSKSPAQQADGMHNEPASSVNQQRTKSPSNSKPGQVDARKQTPLQPRRGEQQPVRKPSPDRKRPSPPGRSPQDAPSRYSPAPGQRKASADSQRRNDASTRNMPQPLNKQGGEPSPPNQRRTPTQVQESSRRPPSPQAFKKSEAQEIPRNQQQKPASQRKPVPVPGNPTGAAYRRERSNSPRREPENLQQRNQKAPLRNTAVGAPVQRAGRQGSPQQRRSPTFGPPSRTQVPGRQTFEDPETREPRYQQESTRDDFDPRQPALRNRTRPPPDEFDPRGGESQRHVLDQRANGNPRPPLESRQDRPLDRNFPQQPRPGRPIPPREEVMGQRDFREAGYRGGREQFDDNRGGARANQAQFRGKEEFYDQKPPPPLPRGRGGPPPNGNGQRPINRR